MKQWNRWKIAFITLITIFLISLAGGLALLYSLSRDDVFERPHMITSELIGPKFTVTTTKDDLNLWISRELEMEQPGSVPFQLYIDQYVHFKTVIPAFGFNIPVEMTLEPSVTETGNLELYERTFHIGDFSLPSERVFQLVQRTVELPPWILISPEERKFYLNLDAISDDIRIEVETFDLQEDILKFILTL